MKYCVIARRVLLGSFALIASLVALGTSPVPANADRGKGGLVLNRPGVYQLSRNLTVRSGGDAIVITADGVTLDLNGYTVAPDDPGVGRGIVIAGAKGVTVRNGKVGSFNINVEAGESENVVLERLQIVGANLPLPNPPGPPPAEIGILLVNTRGARIEDNTITGVGLGIFVRGPLSGGNRIVNNTLVGGPVTSRSLLGMCWNPAPGAAAGAPGPRGDLVTGNQVSLFQTAISFSAASVGNIARGNYLAFVSAPYSPTTDVAGNVIDNTTIQVQP